MSKSILKTNNKKKPLTVMPLNLVCNYESLVLVQACFQLVHIT